jgi:hypothetical protein
MNTKALLIGIVAILVIGAGAYYVISSTSSQQNTPMDMTDMSGMSTEDMANMDQGSPALVEDNAVIVSDQRPGTTIMGTAYLAAPGYLVIHQNNAGRPGAVIGQSALLSAGEHRGVRITLTRATRDGETLYALLHAETDGNGAFGSADATVQSDLGGPIQGTFMISSSASADTPVSI